MYLPLGAARPGGFLIAIKAPAAEQTGSNRFVLVAANLRQRPTGEWNHFTANSCLIPNFSTRFRNVARVTPRSLAACTWFPLVSIRA